MMAYMVVSGSVGAVVILSYMGDPSGTIYHLGQILTARGLAWTAKKITEGINKDASQMIDFTGWSIAGVSIIRIIWNAKNNLGYGVSSIAKFLDWITFWN